MLSPPSSPVSCFSKNSHPAAYINFLQILLFPNSHIPALYFSWHLKVAFCKNIWNKLKWNGSHSDEAGELSRIKDPSKLKSYLFQPLAPSRDENEGNEACNIYENQVSSSSSIVNIKWCKCGKCKSMNTDPERRFCMENNETPGNFWRQC